MRHECPIKLQLFLVEVLSLFLLPLLKLIPREIEPQLLGLVDEFDAVAEDRRHRRGPKIHLPVFAQALVPWKT